MKKRILIVDDEVTSARLLKLNLEATGRFDVRVENWAENAIGAAREFMPDLIFLDIMMPRMFGGDVAAQMQADTKLKSVPIVFLTAAISRDRVEDHEGTINGFPFIAKPASVDEVIQCIDRQLQA
jgi:CheY-like chemotaxis protein